MPIPDRVVTRALTAWESLPAESGREARMRAALEAVRRKPAAEEGEEDDGE